MANPLRIYLNSCAKIEGSGLLSQRKDMATMELKISSRNVINIANQSNYDILVIASPNKDWLPADVAFSFVKSAVLSAATSGAATGVGTVEKLSSLSKAIKSAKDLYSTFSKLQKLYRTMDAVSKKHFETKQENVLKLLRVCAIKIPKRSHMAVNDKVLNPFEGVKPMIPDNFVETAKSLSSNKTVHDLALLLKDASVIPQIANNMMNILDPSMFMSVFSDVGDITLFVARSDFSRVSTFNSNSNHSWIVKDDEIVRARYGTIQEEDKSAGWQFFSNSIGSTLSAGEYLGPNESIDIQTVNYESENSQLADNRNDRMDDLPDSVLGGDIPDSPVNVDEAPNALNLTNLAKGAGRVLTNGVKENVVDPAKNLAGGLIGATKTIGSSPYKLHYGINGNLVLYKISGDFPEAIWSSGTAGRPAWRVCMQKDGNLVLYSAPDKVEWSLWREVPGKTRVGSYVGLHRVSGKLGYFSLGMDTPDFYVNEKDDCYLAAS